MKQKRFRPFIILQLVLLLCMCDTQQSTRTIYPVFATRGLSALFQAYMVDEEHQRWSGQIDRDVLSNPEFFNENKAIIENAARKNPNFAGHYRIAEWGCGTECQTGVIIDLLSGKMYILSTSEWGRLYKTGSKLLIENPPLDAVESKHRPEYAFPVYHVWTGSKFKLLCNTTAPETCQGKVDLDLD